MKFYSGKTKLDDKEYFVLGFGDKEKIIKEYYTNNGTINPVSAVDALALDKIDIALKEIDEWQAYDIENGICTANKGFVRVYDGYNEEGRRIAIKHSLVGLYAYMYVHTLNIRDKTHRGYEFTPYYIYNGKYVTTKSIMVVDRLIEAGNFKDAHRRYEKIRKDTQRR